MTWVWLIVVGALVGVLARLLHPGREPLDYAATFLIGIASLVLAGIVISSNVWAFVVGVVVAVVVVTAWMRFIRKPAV